jgi:hypothetical protein
VVVFGGYARVAGARRVTIPSASSIADSVPVSSNKKRASFSCLEVLGCASHDASSSGSVVASFLFGTRQTRS